MGAWLLLAGIGILLITALVFWFCLPRGGKTHRFVGTEFEPYVAVAICAGIALGFCMVITFFIERPS